MPIANPNVWDTPERLELRSMVRKFVEKHILPY